MEPFITPRYYQKYPSAIDEWTLSVAMAADQASGGLSQLEEHYKTFIVRLYSPLHTEQSRYLIHTSDRGGFCSDRWRRPELGPAPDSFLGHRHVGRGAVPAQGLLEVRAQG